MDAMGHVNHAVYFSYMEYGRQEYWFTLTGLRDIRAFNFIVGKAECTYKSPAVIGEVVLVSLGCTRLGNASFTMDYVLSDERTGRLIATASTELVCFDYDAKRPRRIPPDMRQKIQDFEDGLRAKAAAAR